jgi:surface antigen
MINLLIGDSITRQQEILTIINKPTAIVQQVKPELSVQEKIKQNYYKCNTDVQYIRADTAECLNKPVAVQTVDIPTQARKPAKQAQSSSGNTYQVGQCTHFVASKRYVPNNWGNASSWYSSAQAAGWTTSSVPVAGAVGWSSGHVVYVELVNGDGTVTISEQNYDWNSGIRTITVPVEKYLYIY